MTDNKAPSVTQAVPVSWQSRARQRMEDYQTEWSEWRDGKAPRPIPFYWDVEERPLYTHSDDTAELRAENERLKAENEKLSKAANFALSVTNCHITFREGDNWYSALLVGEPTVIDRYKITPLENEDKLRAENERLRKAVSRPF